MTTGAALTIDHILYVAADLDTASDHLWRTYGLEAIDGGRHAAWGTGNRLVPIGDHYIELFSVIDRGIAEGNAVGQWLLSASTKGDGPRAVCLRSTEFEMQAARLNLSIQDGERIYPDGRRVVWRQAGVAEAMLTGRPYFLFDWPQQSLALRLGQRAPRHATELAGIASVKLRGPIEDFPDLGPAIDIQSAAEMALDHVVIARNDGSVFEIPGGVQ